MEKGCVGMETLQRCSCYSLASRQSVLTRMWVHESTCPSPELACSHRRPYFIRPCSSEGFCSLIQGISMSRDEQYFPWQLIFFFFKLVFGFGDRMSLYSLGSPGMHCRPGWHWTHGDDCPVRMECWDWSKSNYISQQLIFITHFQLSKLKQKIIFRNFIKFILYVMFIRKLI